MKAKWMCHLWSQCVHYCETTCLTLLPISLNPTVSLNENGNLPSRGLNVDFIDEFFTGIDTHASHSSSFRWYYPCTNLFITSTSILIHHIRLLSLLAPCERWELCHCAYSKMYEVIGLRIHEHYTRAHAPGSGSRNVCGRISSVTISASV